MRRALPVFVVITLAVATGLACHSPSHPDGPRMIVGPAQIDSVDLVRGVAPSGFGVHVKGLIGDGCSELLPFAQTRSGNVVTLTIQRQRPEMAICTQIAKLFDQVIPLQGSFGPGEYAVRVNTTELAFSVP
jgi:hypothetical protein